jgi:hypothetical protein
MHGTQLDVIHKEIHLRWLPFHAVDVELGGVQGELILVQRFAQCCIVPGQDAVIHAGLLGGHVHAVRLEDPNFSGLFGVETDHPQGDVIPDHRHGPDARLEITRLWRVMPNSRDIVGDDQPFRVVPREPPDAAAPVRQKVREPLAPIQRGTIKFV